MSNFQQTADKVTFPSPAELFAFLSLIPASVGGFFTILSRSTIAARECERLYHLGDDELADRGLTRDDIPSHVVSKYLSA